jgi:hypothetical protein
MREGPDEHSAIAEQALPVSQASIPKLKTYSAGSAQQHAPVGSPQHAPPARVSATQVNGVLCSSAGGAREDVNAPLIADEDSDSLMPATARHHAHLDLTRIVCVILVVVDHGASAYSKANTLFAQNWTVQALFMVSSICFCMSSRSLGAYLLRCCSYMLAGIACNTAAWKLQGLDWQGDFFNVVFQFWFVVGLMISGTLLAPMKSYLKRVSAARASQGRLHASYARDAMAGIIILLIARLVVGMGKLRLQAKAQAYFVDPAAAMGHSTGWAHWGMPQTQGEIEVFVERLCGYTTESLCAVVIVLVGSLVLSKASQVSWVLIAFIYSSRIMFYHGQEDRPFHHLNLFLLAMVCYFLGIANRREVSRLIVRYWFVLLIAAGLLWPPGMQRRMDEKPPFSLELRLRYNSLELMAVVVWLTTAERMFDPRIFTEDRMDWVCSWSLVLFIVHKAVHILVPSPWNWISFLLIGLACWLAHGALGGGTSRSSGGNHRQADREVVRSMVKEV